MAGELVRLWGVSHIGAISRTRSDRLGPLIDTGPFAFVRNPLYLGNIALWAGFALTAGLPWLAPIIIIVLGAVYHAIVRWEEGLLETRLGAAYREYAARTPRWLPHARPSAFAKATADKSTSSGRAIEIDPLMVSPSTPLILSPSKDESLRTGPSNHERFSWGDTLFSERGTLIAMGTGYLLLWLKAHS